MDFSCRLRPLEQSLEFEGISHTPKLEDDVESPAVLLSPSGCPPTAAPLAKEPLRLMRFLAVLLLLGVCLAGYLITARSLPEPANTTAANAAAASQANENGNDPMRGCLYDQKVKEKMDKKSQRDRDYEKLYLQNQKSRAQKIVEERERGQSNNGNGHGNGNGGGRRLLQQATQLDVPVTFHVILPAGLATLAAVNSNGGLGALQAQIARLNTDFADGFTGTNDIWSAVRIKNPTPKWNFYLDSYKVVFAVMGETPETQSTRVVGKLNIWIGDMTGSYTGTLGYAFHIGTDQNLNEWDGVYLLYTSLPGSTFYNMGRRNMGRVATHEVGHFFDLVHIWGSTSGGGCTNGNDGIADTVAADDANYNCGSSNTVFCAGVTREMYENFMDYTDDSCIYMFTKMQNEVMKSAWGTVAWAQTNSDS
eukprot:g20998.t1